MDIREAVVTSLIAVPMLIGRPIGGERERYVCTSHSITTAVRSMECDRPGCITIDYSSNNNSSIE